MFNTVNINSSFLPAFNGVHKVITHKTPHEDLRLINGTAETWSLLEDTFESATIKDLPGKNARVAVLEKGGTRFRVTNYNNTGIEIITSSTDPKAKDFSEIVVNAMSKNSFPKKDALLSAIQNLWQTIEQICQKK